jgi:hypothetical protein|tara:strand:+ start:589 stop:786 length:198 start_codon:yes stop_codon:yes gene_type:complete
VDLQLIMLVVAEVEDFVEVQEPLLLVELVEQVRVLEQQAQEQQTKVVVEVEEVVVELQVVVVQES